jgi:hypothetical protein
MIESKKFYEDDEFIIWENELVSQTVVNRYSLIEDAFRHLREGFARRVYMMQCSRIFLRDHTKREPDNLPDPYLIEELNVHLNSYYINLRGCLDNLAWALNYQLSLVPANEHDPTRKNCDLFGKRFFNALQQHLPDLHDFLKPFENWIAELRNLRDPAAHRVPISVIGGSLRPESLTEFNSLMAKAAAPESELGGHSRSHFVREAYRLAEYTPLLIVSGAKGLESREIALQVGNDHHQFLTLAKGVLARFFIAITNPGET